MNRLFLILVALGMFFTLPGQAQEEDLREPPRDGVFQPRSVEERRPVELAHIREVDVIWSKRVWQYIDVRKKMNQPLYFPERPTGNYRSLMQVLEDGIRSGEIRAYSPDDDSFDNEPYDPEELFDVILSDVEEVEVEPGITREVDVPFRPTDVLLFRIKEEWFVDNRRGKLDVRIIGLSPAFLQEDPVTGETSVHDPLFWIPFEDARPVLANAPVMNRRNDRQMMSYDDLFIRRFFDATIYREARPDGRAIREYIADPYERLLESQRIKDEIRNFELDLWHY